MLPLLVGIGAGAGGSPGGFSAEQSPSGALLYATFTELGGIRRRGCMAYVSGSGYPLIGGYFRRYACFVMYRFMSLATWPLLHSPAREASAAKYAARPATAGAARDVPLSTLVPFSSPSSAPLTFSATAYTVIDPPLPTSKELWGQRPPVPSTPPTVIKPFFRFPRHCGACFSSDQP
jgi:hypothetical protein